MEIKTIPQLEKALRAVYCKETAYPGCQALWLPNDPTYGQCAVTARIVQDYFGGTIRRIRVQGGGTHYFNEIDGKIIDLTREQFDIYNIPLNHEPNEIMTTPFERLSKDMKYRYNLLKERLERYINGSSILVGSYKINKN